MQLLRKFRPSFVVIALLAAAAIAATVAVACDDTGPSPIGEHFDDAGKDTSTPAEAGDDGSADGSDEASDDGGDEGGDADAGEDADAADAKADG